MAYDPQKAHEYYLRIRQLKGRLKTDSIIKPHPAKADPVSTHLTDAKAQKAKARVERLKAKISKLHGALSEAQAALSKHRQTAAKQAKTNSDGKTTTKERQAAKEYRDKNQAKIKAKAAAAAKSGGSGSTSSSKSVSDMGVKELEARIIKIKSVLNDAEQQLSDASQQLGQLAHSAITSEPMFNEHFAHFQSAERIPSK